MAIELGCIQFEEAVSDYTEGILAPDAAAAMRRHAHRCAACAELLEEVRQALGLLADLPELEAPRRLEARILQRTLAPREALGWNATLRSLWYGLLQPKFVLGFSMAVFAFALVVNAAGIDLRHLRMVDLAPAQVSVSMRRNFNRTLARGVAYYNDLRVVYEIQAALHQMRQGDSHRPPDQRDHSERNWNRPLQADSPVVAALVSVANRSGIPGEGGWLEWQGSIPEVGVVRTHLQNPVTEAPTSGDWTKREDRRPVEEI